MMKNVQRREKPWRARAESADERERKGGGDEHTSSRRYTRGDSNDKGEVHAREMTEG